MSSKMFLRSIIFVIIMTAVNAHTSCGSKECPDFSFALQFNNTESLISLQSDLLNKVWDSKSLPTPTPLSLQLRSILDLMMTSDSYQMRTISFLHTFRMASILTSPLDKANFCLYAKTVNASVNYAESKDPRIAAKSLQGLTDAVKYLIPMMSKASLKQAGCSNFPQVDSVSGGCYDKGLTYDIEDCWNIYGILLPCPLRNVVFRMYKSENLADRVHAVFVTAAISTLGRELFEVHPPGPVLKNLAILTTAPIPAWCCAALREQTDELTTFHNRIIQENSRKIILQKYSIQ